MWFLLGIYEYYFFYIALRATRIALICDFRQFDGNNTRVGNKADTGLIWGIEKVYQLKS